MVQVVTAGAVPLLVLCSQEPEVSLKQTAAFALGELAKHSAEQAQAVVDAGAVAYLAPLSQDQDVHLKIQVSVAMKLLSASLTPSHYFDPGQKKAARPSKRYLLHMSALIKLEPLDLTHE